MPYVNTQNQWLKKTKYEIRIRGTSYEIWIKLCEIGVCKTYFWIVFEFAPMLLSSEQRAMVIQGTFFWFCVANIHRLFNPYSIDWGVWFGCCRMDYHHWHDCWQPAFCALSGNGARWVAKLAEWSASALLLNPRGWACPAIDLAFDANRFGVWRGGTPSQL